jgi:predicted nucleic acid binding AN1-type Zn finger protein
MTGSTVDFRWNPKETGSMDRQWNPKETGMRSMDRCLTIQTTGQKKKIIIILKNNYNYFKKKSGWFGPNRLELRTV